MSFNTIGSVGTNYWRVRGLYSDTQPTCSGYIKLKLYSVKNGLAYSFNTNVNSFSCTQCTENGLRILVQYKTDLSTAISHAWVIKTFQSNSVCRI